MSKTLYPVKGKSSIVAAFAIAFVAMFAMLFLPVDAFAADLAAGAKKDFSDTFGKDSTFMYILLGLEIVSAVFLYIKSKNLAVFGGLIAVMLFTTVAFNLIG